MAWVRWSSRIWGVKRVLTQSYIEWASAGSASVSANPGAPTRRELYDAVLRSRR